MKKSSQLSSILQGKILHHGQDSSIVVRATILSIRRGKVYYLQQDYDYLEESHNHYPILNELNESPSL